MKYAVTVTITTMYRKVIEEENQEAVERIIDNAFRYDGFDETWSVDMCSDGHIDEICE